MLSHDASSPSSQRILSLLQARVRPDALSASGATASASGAAPSQDNGSPARKYLDAASSQQATSSAPFELEVLDRSKATSDQWNTIGSFLSKNRRSQVEQLKEEQGPLVVNWEDGQALQTEGEVQTLLDRMSKENAGAKSSGGGGGGCVIA